MQLVELAPPGPPDDSGWVDQRDPLHRRVEGRAQPRAAAGAQALDRIAGRRGPRSPMPSRRRRSRRRGPRRRALPCSGSGGTGRREPCPSRAGSRRSTCRRSRAHRTARRAAATIAARVALPFSTRPSTARNVARVTRKPTDGLLLSDRQSVCFRRERKRRPDDRKQLINAPAIQYVRIPDGTRIAYRELGDGPAVLLVHGWPTSSFLWRNVMPALGRAQPRGGDRPARVRRVGQAGRRSATTSTSSSGRSTAFLAAVGIDRVAIVGHDLGGPVVVHWALGRLERVTGIGLLNTLLYPEFSRRRRGVRHRAHDPAGAQRLTSDAGLAEIMRLGRVGPRGDHRRDRRRRRRAVPQRAGRRRWRGPATGWGSGASSRSPPASARSRARSRWSTAPATRSCRTSARRSSDSSATCRMP